MKLLRWLVTIAFFTSSFDIFLVVTVGANFRIAQILLVFLMILAAARIAQTGTILWPRGATALAIWCAFQFILLFRSPAIVPSLQLLALLMLSILGVFAMVQLYGRSAKPIEFFRPYLQSFVFVAAFGLYQFLSPILHLGGPLVQQWIRHGSIARINGFSYEPSYFATYLVMGWVMIIDLRLARARIVEGRRWFWYTWLVSAALFLSTSKTGWIMMILEGVLRLAPHLFRPLKFHVRRMLAGSLRIKLPPAPLGLRVAVIGIVASLAIFQVSRVVPLNTFLQGTGINNTASHSLTSRVLWYQKTLQVVHQEPWFGLTLGGVAERIAQNSGEAFDTAEAVKTHWAFPVPLEVLAASGIVGFIPFVWFFMEISIGERTLLRTHASDERAKWLHALIRALAFEWLCLAADQNLVRVYLWLHIAVLMALAWNLRYGSASAQAVSSGWTRP